MISLDAEKYKTTGFEQAYFDEVFRCLCENKRYDTPNAVGKNRVVKELVWCLKKYGLLNYLVSEEVQNKSFENLEDEDFKDIMRALILADFLLLKDMYEHLHDPDGEYAKELSAARKKDKKAKLEEPFKFLEYFGRNAYAGMLNLEINLPQISSEKGKIPIRMVQTLEVRTCPYCNRAFIGSAKNEKLGVQLDHFYSKSNYPFFAVSLYNLIPCCSSCNMNKSDDDVSNLISPFDKECSFDKNLKFLFTEYEKEREGKEPLKIQKVQLEYKDKYKPNVDEFHLEAAYAFHSTEAKRFYDKMRAYPPSLLREIANHMTVTDKDGNKVESIPAEALEMGLFQEYFSEAADYIKKPLAKFYRDLYYKYRGWD